MPATDGREWAHKATAWHWAGAGAGPRYVAFVTGSGLHGRHQA